MITNPDLARKHLPSFSAALFKAAQTEADRCAGVDYRADLIRVVCVALEPAWRATVLAPLFHLELTGTSPKEAAGVIAAAFEATSEAEVRNFARLLGVKRNSTREGSVLKEVKTIWDGSGSVE
jgi:hypothetical protein